MKEFAITLLAGFIVFGGLTGLRMVFNEQLKNTHSPCDECEFSGECDNDDDDNCPLSGLAGTG